MRFLEILAAASLAGGIAMGCSPSRQREVLPQDDLDRLSSLHEFGQPIGDSPHFPWFGSVVDFRNGPHIGSTAEKDVSKPNPQSPFPNE